MSKHFIPLLFLRRKRERSEKHNALECCVSIRWWTKFKCGGGGGTGSSTPVYFFRM